MKKSLIFAFLAACLAAACATDDASMEESALVEENQNPENASVETVDEDDPDRITCRYTQVIGSKFKKRLCGTKAQWETMDQRASDDAREIQRRNRGFEPFEPN